MLQHVGQFIDEDAPDDVAAEVQSWWADVVATHTPAGAGSPV